MYYIYPVLVCHIPTFWTSPEHLVYPTCHNPTTSLLRTEYIVLCFSPKTTGTPKPLVTNINPLRSFILFVRFSLIASVTT